MGLATSKPKGLKITAHDKAILDLKVQRDKLRQYQKKLEVVISKEVDVAKHHLKAGDKKRALLALRKKKYQEALLDKTDKQLFTLEQMTQTIEYSLIEQDIMAGLKKGNEVLAEIHKEMSVEAVAKLMDDTADAIAYQNEIDELLGGQISNDDMEEVEAELDALLMAEMPAVPETGAETETGTKVDVELPDVPDAELPEEVGETENRKPIKVKRAQEEPVAA
ncbi:Vacuolar protein sorting-associated protein 20 [Irineochytrium annulatum]|nr:Vacuolar protein sorting-associated protein 20 [Irineochytrium annulatum]